MFRSDISEPTFNNKYRHDGSETWSELASTVVNDVSAGVLTKDDKDQLTQYITDMKFMPGGRYLYYAGRPVKFFNNCYLLRAEEDSREDWANVSWKSESCLLTGGGIGVDYSRYRQSGAVIKRTGGVASGPLAKMLMVNEIVRNVMQGGSRRSAIYASLNWRHGDIEEFLTIKNWSKDIKTMKERDFNFPAPLDMTNISINYDTEWLMHYLKTGEVGDVFRNNVQQALTTGEPGFSFNFFEKETETLRNACTEVTSSDDSDVCNLGSINLSRIESMGELADVTDLAIKFLMCGTLRADVPYPKISEVRTRNRRLGLGLMGVHEWLIQRGHKYGVVPELHKWLSVYQGVSDSVSGQFADHLSISRPVANRAIAPTGTIGLLAGTTTGIEPIYAVAYKRRYLTDGKKWKYQYAVDYAAHTVIEATGCDPDKIETAFDLAKDYERRIKFQAKVQDYVDMGISSTINLPSCNDSSDDGNINDNRGAEVFSAVLARYASRLRGLTCYPDGSRGGQPLTAVPYKDGLDNLGEEHVEVNDSCDITGGGFCGS